MTNDFYEPRSSISNLKKYDLKGKHYHNVLLRMNTVSVYLKVFLFYFCLLLKKDVNNFKNSFIDKNICFLFLRSDFSRRNFISKEGERGNFENIVPK